MSRDGSRKWRGGRNRKAMAWGVIERWLQKVLEMDVEEGINGTGRTAKS
jgi:hypothetical protein